MLFFFSLSSRHPLVVPDVHHSCLDVERVSYGHASTNARYHGPLARDAAADPPTRDAARYRARRGPVTGRVAWHGQVRADRRIRARWREQG